jgi:putative hemolysin
MARESSDARTTPFVSDARTARDISYAFSAKTRAGRALIRSIENLTGRPRLIRMADGYHREVEQGRDFWEVMANRYRLQLSVTEFDIARIPREGPVVVVANHPFGIADGLAMGRILSMARGEFRIMAHKVFHKARDLEKIILPINFQETREAQAENLATRRAAIAHLDAGGCIGIFPGGTVSTSLKPFGRAMDPAWRTFTAKMIQRSRARVVPVFFDGQNSRLFQLASHVNQTLRCALLINEFDREVGRKLRIRIGNPLPQDEIDRFRGDAKALMDHLRLTTYRLGQRCETGYGLDLG